MITFYGHFSGYSSYPTVCRAIANYLHSIGTKDLQLCDLRPQGAYDGVPGISRVPSSTWRAVQEGRADRWNKRPGTALVFGFPEWVRRVAQHERMVGYHVCDVDRIPRHWAHIINTEDLVITPSQWCHGVFRNCGVTTPIAIVHHGVDVAFGAVKRPKLPREPLTFLHTCSAGEPDRKGTLQLVEAWERLASMGEIDAKLTILSSFPEAHAPLAKKSLGIKVISGKVARTPAEMAQCVAGFHGLVQPSRAEGFGMLPLECAAAGLPTLATDCTGHAEHDRYSTSWSIPTGPLAPCGGAQAPSLDLGHVANALLYMIENYDTLQDEANARRSTIMETWAWHKVLENLPELLTPS